jgi:two-component system cell cycle sensor histidine kinase/response regulator CckA
VGNAIPFPVNARKGADLPQRGLSASSVHRIARICALGLAFDELLEEVCREILALSGAEGGVLFFCRGDGVGEKLLAAATSGTHSDLRDAYRPGPAMDRLLDRLRGEGTIRADDTALLPASDPLGELLGALPVRSALLVPLKFGTRLLGFVALHVCEAPKPWGEDVLRAMDLVAALLSAALERRRTEDSLRASEARYRFLAENSPDLISLHDPSGRILYASPASLQMLGIRPELMTGAPHEGFLHPDDAEKIVSETRRVASGEKTGFPLQYRMRRASGEYVEVESAATPIPGASGEDARVLRVTRDVSGRKRMEDRLRENQRLATVGMLAGGVAHEFNNLLAGIHGAVEMLSMVVGGSPQARAYLDVIQRMGNRAVEVTHQLLAYSRQGKYSPVPVPLRQVVEETLPAIRASFPAGIDVSLELEAKLPPAHADVAQMKQVVAGLCLNAVEAMPAGGKIVVRVRREEGGDRIVLEVSDTGVGMDGETMARIFEPFFTTKSVGRGMGLAAIRGIVENHGGEIRAASRPGGGSTFTVLLPASVERRKSVRHAARTPVTGSGRILLADDEPDVRGVVRAMLESLGYSVIEARDGREAVELFRRHNEEIDLVLLDLVMPRLTGEAALEEIRRIDPSVRAVLASGYDESGRIREIVAGGFGGFLQKPFRRQELGEKIEEVLGAPRAPKAD